MIAAAERRLAARSLSAVAATLGEPRQVQQLHDPRLSRPELARYTARCASHHNILPLLWAAIEHGGSTSALRAATLEFYRPAVGHALRLNEVLRRLTAALTAAAVPFAVFKGPALSWRYYRRPEHRISSDVDIVLAAHSLRDARPALIDAGFVGPLDPPADRVPGLAESSYRLPGYGLADVHWHVMREARVRRAFALDTGSMLSRVQRIQIDDMSVPVLDDVDAAISVATHACFDGAYRLGWLVDLAQVLRRVEPAQLRERCAQARVTLPVAVVADRMALALGAPALDGALGPMTGWRAAMGLLSRARPVAQSFQQPLRASVAYRSTASTSLASVKELARLLRTESVPELRSPEHRLRQPRARRDPSRTQ
jgi:hypothetical protein